MVDDKARRMADEALDRLAQELEAGHSEALTNYLAAQGRFHRYSWGNVLLIQSQRPTATRVAGYHTWQELGRAVRRGEKGIMIYVPIRQKDPELPLTVGDPARQSRLTGFRAAYVFDVAQTEGRPLPAFATTTGDPRDHTGHLKALIAKQGIELEYDRSIAPAFGVSTGGRIRLLPDLSPAEEFSVLSHELAHEMLHHRKDDPRLPIGVRETQAEAVSYVVCRAVGLETHTAAADYIKLYNGDRETLSQSLSAIHETSARILDELLPQDRTRPALLPAEPERDIGRANSPAPSEDRPPSDRDAGPGGPISLDR